MQIEITTNAGQGEVILLPPELALDDSELTVDVPGVVIPGRPGRHVYDRFVRLEPRSVRASGSIKGLDPADADTLAEDLRRKLVGNGELWLKRYQEADRFLRVRATRVHGSFNRGRYGGSLFTLNITLEADNPWYYATEYQTVERVVQASGETWTVNQPGSAEYQEPVVYIKCNDGATGPLVNPQLTNTVTGDVAAYTGQIEPGQALALRCRPMKAYMGLVDLATVISLWGEDGSPGTAPPGATSVLGAINEDWLVTGWRLTPGDNVLLYEDDVASSHDAAVALAWRPRYY